MTKFYVTLATVAALVALSVAGTSAHADSDCTDAKDASTKTTSNTQIAALDTPRDSSTYRKIELQAEPIEQAGQVAEPAAQPADPSDPAPEAPTPVAVDAAVEEPAAVGDTSAGATEPQTAKRMCRKFSAAIATVIEVPCE